MSKSDSIKELAAALSKAQGAFDHAKKEVDNQFFKSKYADLASCIDAAKPHLLANSLAVVQTTDIEEEKVILVTTLIHSSGEWISGKYPINPVKGDPQSYGSALTYARRYMFCAITGIAADDDDGEISSSDHLSEVISTINAASSMDTLQAVFKDLFAKYPALRKQIVAEKDKRKQELTNASA